MHAPTSFAVSVAGFMVIAALLPSTPARAATWDIVPSLTVEETFSDNISLSPHGSERSDFVTAITPGISVRAIGDRARFDAEYRPELLWWANQGSTRALHFYDAGGTVELVKRMLFI